MTYMIKTEKLTKRYGSYPAVNQVSLELKKGDIYGLIGKNGAGKSTLFKMFMGLTEPHEGKLMILDETTTSGLNHRRRQIGFMIGNNFFSYLNARDNLEYYRKLKGIVDTQEIDRVLKLVELDGVKKPFKAFSMGMKQRLGIANALMGNPDIVILDEPVNGLDPQGIADFRKLIQKLNKEYGITFMISSHILGELGIMGTCFGFIHQGRMIEQISAEELHERTRSSLMLKVDDVAKASALIEEELTSKRYRVLDQRTILLEDYLQESEKVGKLMYDHGVVLYQLAIHETSLEEYFLNLIGGQHD